MQFVIYTIREINQHIPRALTNFSIGYDIYGTCGGVSFASRDTLQMLKAHSEHSHSCLVPDIYESALQETKAKALIGENCSYISVAVAQVVTLPGLLPILRHLGV